MAIEFTCPSCRQLVSTPDAAAGRKGRCPHCAGVVQIPAASSPVPAAAGGAIEFHCGACQQLVSCPPSAAGKRGRCPHCQAVMHVPLASGGTSAPSATLAASQVSTADQQAMAAAAALAARTDPWTNFEVQTFKPGAKPLTVWDGSDRARAPDEAELPRTADKVNTKEVIARVLAEETHHRGLPWDDDTNLASLRDTMFYMCTSPKEAFDDMHRKGGFAVPFTFLVFSHLMAQIIPPGIFLALGVLIAFASGEGLNIDYLQLAFVCGIYFLIALGAAVAGALLFSTIGSGCLHLFLLIQGAARDSFEATFRIICYSTGAASLLSATILLMPIAPVYAFVLPIIGVYRVHRVPVWQATLTVIPAILVSFVVIVLLMWVLILIVVGIAAAEFQMQQANWRLNGP